MVYLLNRFSRLFTVIAAGFLAARGGLPADEAPVKPDIFSKEERQANSELYREAVHLLSRSIAKGGVGEKAFSQRGDAYFFLGNFKEAVADYDKMIELKPEIAPLHWRRGIALFYTERYEDAAKQFEAYHTIDDVDRENGIWRYLCQRKAFGPEKARQGLLKYKRDDREPFPDVYKLFAGEITPAEILKRIETAKIDRNEREKRLFYANLYIGLNEAVEGRTETARQHLRQAVTNTWGPRGSYGPAYMWHVGRLQYEQINTPRKP